MHQRIVESRWFRDFVRPSRPSSVRVSFFIAACGFAALHLVATSLATIALTIAVVASAFATYGVLRAPVRNPSALLWLFLASLLAYLLATLGVSILGAWTLHPTVSLIFLCVAAALLMRAQFMDTRWAVVNDVQRRVNKEHPYIADDDFLAKVELEAALEVWGVYGTFLSSMPENTPGMWLRINFMRWQTRAQPHTSKYVTAAMGGERYPCSRDPRC